MRSTTMKATEAILSVCLSACLSVCLSLCLSDCLPLCLSVRLSVCLYVCLSRSPYVCLSGSRYVYPYHKKRHEITGQYRCTQAHTHTLRYTHIDTI